MKRKRGHKKGKSKKIAAMAEPANQEETSANSEENSGSDDDNDDGKAETDVEEKVEAEPEKTKVETPPPPQPPPPVVIQRPPTTAVYGRVKVKLKASKPVAVDSQPPPPASSEAEKSGQEQKVVLDKQGSGEKQKGEIAAEKAEDGASSVPESKKCGGIKILSARNSLSPPSGRDGSPDVVVVEEKKKVEEEVKVVEQKVKVNKKELEASLEVIKKVMKMDAAEPFNVPVNPIELGIPDYFDIIDTPMDFGTIRNNLESGTKYMDSEDVYNDVKYIWNNCYKYNNKGDYIVDLMKRVKKNFMKYWVAAGLYTEQTRKTSGGESAPMDEATTSGHGKKVKRGKGVKRHKDDCMCAICIMKRRRREREAREAQEAREAGVLVTPTHSEAAKTGLAQEYKQEESSHVDSPFGEDTSSYMETSPDNDGDAEMEDGETRLEGITPQYDDEQRGQDNRIDPRDKSDRSEDVSEKSQRSDKVETEPYNHGEGKAQDESASGIKSYAQGQSSVQGHLQHRHELMELEKKRQKLRLLETFCDLENPALSELCGTLFPSKPQSVWNGPNSLIRSQKPHLRKTTGIHEAIASFMTPACKSSSSLK